MSDEQPIKFYTEIRKESGWETVAAHDDDVAGLRSLVKTRDSTPTARVRITDSTGKIVLDVPPAVLDVPVE
jgi:hypothetical protein